MKNQKVLDSVLEFIKANPDSSIEAITVGIKSSDISWCAASLKAYLMTMLSWQTPTLALSALPRNQVNHRLQKRKQKLKLLKKDDDLGPKTFTGRDNSKYRFGELRNLPKGRLVLALVRAYVDKNKKVSLSKLQEVFHSDEIQPRYGIITELSVAKSFSKTK